MDKAYESVLLFVWVVKLVLKAAKKSASKKKPIPTEDAKNTPRGKSVLDPTKSSQEQVPRENQDGTPDKARMIHPEEPKVIQQKASISVESNENGVGLEKGRSPEGM